MKTKKRSSPQSSGIEVKTKKGLYPAALQFMPYSEISSDNSACVVCLSASKREKIADVWW